MHNEYNILNVLWYLMGSPQIGLAAAASSLSSLPLAKLCHMFQNIYLIIISPPMILRICFWCFLNIISWTNKSMDTKQKTQRFSLSRIDVSFIFLWINLRIQYCNYFWLRYFETYFNFYCYIENAIILFNFSNFNLKLLNLD